MSYDLAVWVGDRPAEGKPAGRALAVLYDHYLDADVVHPPSERIAAYVAALPQRWCDVTEDVGETSPWAAGPLIGGAGGPLVYFAMRWDRAEEASAYAAALADSMGLVCFDPQWNRLRP
ncbi:hypothetical protein [Embleya sp. NBC_00896]|uniref:hypothetical protein n=1 Tax=Embleya sp. NBC_00896 TaxID=2975961 RepID=UPI002F916DC2|nr:hypothetical protein OG928_33375 [Embleya sp. NBC_00896]